MKFYGDIFREIRKSKNIPISKLAKAIDRSYNAILKWEKGERNPSASDVRFIALILGINPSEISNLNDDLPGQKTTKTGYNKKVYDDLLIEKDLEELRHLKENYGVIPDINIEAIIRLEKRVNIYRRQIKTLNAKLTDYENILNLAPVIIYSKDSLFHYKYVNDRFIAHTGLCSKENIIGSTTSKIFGFNEAKEINKYEQEVFKSNTDIYNKEIRIPGTNGKSIGLLNIIPYIDKHSNVEKILCSINDITYLKKLLDRFEKLDSLLNIMDEYIYIRTFNPTRFIYGSKGIESITGYNKIEFLNDKNLWLNLIHPDDKKEAEIPDFDTEFKCCVQRYRIQHKSGIYKWVENRRYRYYMPESHIYYDYGIIKDITDQMAKEELEELLIMYTDFINLAISIMNYDTKEILYVNKKYERISGYTSKEVITQNAYKFVLQHFVLPEDKEEVERILEDESIKNYKTRMITKSKKIKLILIRRKNIIFKGKKCRFVSYKVLKNLGTFEGNSQ
ncbi:MAG TPA: PAS domain S-box protein [Victivallales bacterium]|nr:PAS domain S-box protein [Victivallales bacterium]